MRKALLPFTFCLLTVSLFAQEESLTIATDRPSQTAASSIVPVGRLQVEAGYILEQDQVADGTNLNFLIRWGINEFFELRFQQDYLTTDVEGASFSGLSPTKLGIKTVIAKSEGGLPEVALLGSIALPSGEDIYTTSSTVPEFAFAVSRPITDRFSIAYNLGMRWEDDTPQHSTFYTLNFGYVFSDQLSAFVEPYGFFRKDTKADTRFNGGVVYLVKPRFQVDLTGGVGITEQSPDSFVSFGAAVIF